MSSEHMDWVGALETGESSGQNTSMELAEQANSGPNVHMQDSSISFPDPSLDSQFRALSIDQDDDAESLSNYSENYPPFDNEDNGAELSEGRERADSTSYGHMSPYSMPPDVRARREMVAEMFVTQHNSVEPSLHEDSDIDMEDRVDPNMVDDYYYHNPTAPNPQRPSHPSSQGAVIPSHQGAMASNLAYAGDTEVGAAATTPLSALDLNSQNVVGTAEPESPASDSYPDLIDPFLTPPDSRNPSVPVAVDSYSAQAPHVGPGPVDSLLAHDAVDQIVHPDTDIHGAHVPSDPAQGLDRLHLHDQDPHGIQTHVAQGLSSDPAQVLGQLHLHDQDTHHEETRVAPEVSSAPAQVIKYLRHYKQELQPGYEPDVGQGVSSDPAQELDLLNLDDQDHQSDIEIPGSLPELESVGSPTHDTVIDPNTQIASTHEVTDTLPNDNVETEDEPVVKPTIPELPVNIIDFIYWVAKESKFRFLLGFKTRWTSAEIQAVVGKAVELREARRASSLSAPNREAVLAADMKEFEDAPLEREKNLEKLGEYWDQFHAECIENLSITLGNNGAKPHEIETLVDAEGKPDVYQMIGKLWHIWNPTPDVKEFKIHLGRTSLGGTLHVMEMWLPDDTDYQEFWRTLTEWAPHPEYLPEGDPDDGEYYEYDLGPEIYVGEEEDKVDTEPVIAPMDEDDVEMPDAAAEAPPTGPKLTWTFRVLGAAQIEDLLEKLNGETPAGSHGAKYGRVWEIREEADYQFMRLEMSKLETPHVILMHQAYIEENRRVCARRAAFAAKRARESGDVEGEEEWWVQKPLE